jgi:DNA-binding LytR/AlgR family response regulator
MELKCIIIEDEPLAAEKLEGFVKSVQFLSLVGSFDNAIDGLSFIKNNKVDLLFLDIQMEKLTGIQMLETLIEKPYVIITSAYSNYALKGYELSVFDYLLKPYSFERFLASVNRVCDDAQQKKTAGQTNSHIFVKTEYRLENIALNEILYIEGMQGYLRIVLPCKKIMVKQSFKNILEQLPSNEFVQVHKSWVVALSKISSIEHNRIKIGEKLIPIGDSYRNRFYEMVNNKIC